MGKEKMVIEIQNIGIMLMIRRQLLEQGFRVCWAGENKICFARV